MSQQGIILVSQKHRVARLLEQMSKTIENFRLHEKVLNEEYFQWQLQS